MKSRKVDVLVVLGVVLALIPSIVCPPVNPNKVEEKVKDAKEGPTTADDHDMLHEKAPLTEPGKEAHVENEAHGENERVHVENEKDAHVEKQKELHMEKEAHMENENAHVENEKTHVESEKAHVENEKAHEENEKEAHVEKNKENPVEKNDADEEKETEKSNVADKFRAPSGLELEYQRYLNEIMDQLDNDEGFRKSIVQYKKENNGSQPEKSDISRHLEFVNHNVRTKLDEVKRREIERIKVLMKERVHKQQGKDVDWKAIMPGMDHLDFKNPDSFEVKDLDRLIKQATTDLDEIDKKRRDEFKQYELEKEHERREKIQKMDAPHRKQAEEEYETQKKKHKEHPKLHEPGSKAQLEEVWEKEDHLEKDQFDPKAFFKLHDTNGDGFLTADEVEALFNVELQKLYEEGHPEDDMVEKFEEMNRMREKVYKEIDSNKDGAISYEEFLNNTKKKDFEKDEGWKGLDEEEQFTEDDYKEYEKQLRENGDGETVEHEEKPKMEAPKAGGVVQMQMDPQQEAPKDAQHATKDEMHAQSTLPPAPRK